MPLLSDGLMKTWQVVGHGCWLGYVGGRNHCSFILPPFSSSLLLPPRESKQTELIPLPAPLQSSQVFVIQAKLVCSLRIKPCMAIVFPFTDLAFSNSMKLFRSFGLGNSEGVTNTLLSSSFMYIPLLWIVLRALPVFFHYPFSYTFLCQLTAVLKCDSVILSVLHFECATSRKELQTALLGGWPGPSPNSFQANELLFGTF